PCSARAEQRLRAAMEMLEREACYVCRFLVIHAAMPLRGGAAVAMHAFDVQALSPVVLGEFLTGPLGIWRDDGNRCNVQGLEGLRYRRACRHAGHARALLHQLTHRLVPFRPSVETA